MRIPTICFTFIFLFTALPAASQTASPEPRSREGARDNAVKRCRENRGTDCESREGLREWIREERPISLEEQQAAAGARRHREQCAKNPKGTANC
jgi:hypothetical protein